MIKLLFTSALAFTFLALNAQDKKPLELTDAIDNALKNNKAVTIAAIDQKLAVARYQQTDVAYLPHIGFSYTAAITNNPLNAFGFSLQQRSVTAKDFNPELLNHPPGTADFMTRFEIQQPLFNLDMINMRQAALKQTEIYQYQSQRTKEYITFEVTKNYLQLDLAHKSVSVLEESVSTAKKVFQSAENYFNQGLVQKSDVLNAQVFLVTVETALNNAKSNVANISDALSVLMNQPTGTVYTVSGNYPSSTTGDSIPSVSPKRADFLALQKSVEASDLMIKSSKNGHLPKLNAFGSFQFNDPSMFGFGANAYLAGLQLTWDIFKGNSVKNSIASKTLERDKMAEELSRQIETGNQELNRAYRSLNDAMVSLKQTQVSVEQADEAFRIIQNRYNQGLVSTTDMLLSANQLSQQKLNLQQSLFTINVTRAYLQFLTTSTTN